MEYDECFDLCSRLVDIVYLEFTSVKRTQDQMHFSYELPSFTHI